LKKINLMPTLRLFATRAPRSRLLFRMDPAKRKISQVEGDNASLKKEITKKPTTGSVGNNARQSSLLSMWGGKATTDSGKAIASLAVAKPATISRSDFEMDLTEEEKELLKLEMDTLHPEWLKILKPELTKPSFKKVCIMIFMLIQ
jgi:hypothetical protein